MKKLLIQIIARLPDCLTNKIIHICSKRAKPINGDPNVFQEKPYRNPLNLPCEDWKEFLVGSVRGIYFVKNKSYNIVGIQNTQPKNGHFEKAVEWFEKSAKRDNYVLSFRETMNPKLERWLLQRGYIKHKSQLSTPPIDKE